MPPPEFRLSVRLREKKQKQAENIAAKVVASSKSASTDKLSRRMLLKLTDPQKYEKVKQEDRLRSALRRLDRSEEAREHDNRLAAIRQRRYRARKKEKQKAQQQKKGKNRDQRYKTRSELQKLADKRAKDAKRNREIRAAMSTEEREEMLRRRREKYAQDKLKERLAKQAAASTQTPSPQPSPNKVPQPSSRESRRKRVSRATK